MDILYVGLSHRTSGVELRERLVLGPSDGVGYLRGLTGAPSEQREFHEAALLSTCNRFELYAIVNECQAASAHVCHTLARIHEIPESELGPCLVSSRGMEAAQHLCEVAAGLDSMILGEPQVLGQVADAHDMALRAGTSGPTLGMLFRKAIECGKRARADTRICEHAISVSHVAVELAKQVFGSLHDQPVLLVGAGEMAELAARNLLDNGSRNILVVNRSQDRAQELAREIRATALHWEELGSALAEADIVIASTGSRQPIICAEMVRQAMRQRRQRPLFFIDISVPRNVEAQVGRLPSVYLYDIDDLQAVAQENVARREREIPQVRSIVGSSVSEFAEWWRSREVTPTIGDLRAMASSICDAEVARALLHLPPLSDRETETLQRLAQGIVNKLLHNPTMRLKEAANNGDSHEFAGMVRMLFDLDLPRDGEQCG